MLMLTLSRHPHFWQLTNDNKDNFSKRKPFAFKI